MYLKKIKYAMCTCYCVFESYIFFTCLKLFIALVITLYMLSGKKLIALLVFHILGNFIL